MQNLATLLALSPLFAGRPIFAALLVLIATRTTAETPATTRAVVLMAALALFELLSRRPVRWVRSLSELAAVAVRAAEIIVAGLTAGLIAHWLLGGRDGLGIEAGLGAATGLFAWLRGAVLDGARTANVADLPVERHAAFLEYALVAAGVILAFATPRIGAVAALGSQAIVFGLFLTFRSISRGQRVPCAACGQSIHACALACSACHTATSAPRAFGFFGARRSPARQLDRHRRRLLRAGRCPRCAEPLSSSPSGALAHDACTACGLRPFDDPAELPALVSSVDRRVAAVLPLAAAAGLVPVFGWSIAVLLYRLGGGAALSRYAPWTGRAGGSLLKRALLASTAVLQFVPVIGVAVNPLAIATMHGVYRASVLRATAGRDDVVAAKQEARTA